MVSIDFKKTALYLVLVAAIVGSIALYKPTPPPLAPELPKVETKAPPAVEQPAPPPVVKQKPKQKTKQVTVNGKKYRVPAEKPKSRYPHRPVNSSPGCRDVPPEAYRHPFDVVESAMRRLGYSKDQIDTARRCWRGERVP